MKIYATDCKKVINDYYNLSALDGIPSGTSFSYTTSRYRYFVARLVAVSDFDEEVDIFTSPLVGEGQELTRAVSCLNTSGIGASGLFFYRKIKLFGGRMQPLFIGFDLSEAMLGLFTTQISIGSKKVKITLTVNDDLVLNDGADDILSGDRLKWLNSTLGIKDAPVKGYDPLALEDNRLLFTGKEAQISNDGLLEDVISYYSPSNFICTEAQNNLFYKPMEFAVEGQRYRYSKQRFSGKGASVAYSAEGRGDATRTEISATARYEGYIDYKIKLIAEKDIIIDNIVLNFYFAACTYSVGLGKKGGYFAPLEYKWSADKQQDSVFIGDINCGARVRFKDKRDTIPFEGEHFAYKPFVLPGASWDNRGNGSIVITKTKQGAVLCARTGRVILPAGKTCEFDFELYLTPFRQPNLRDHFAHRLFRLPDTDDLARRLERASWHGSNAIELSAPSSAYKHINYPFLSICDIKKAVLEAQTAGFATTLDYSLWHTSISNPELDKFCAFGDELVFRTVSAGVPGQPDEGMTDAVSKNGETSVLMQSGSRLNNYYIEAANYLMDNLRPDGITIEGSHIDRQVAERLKRITDASAAPLGVTLKESDNFSPKKATASSLNLHTHLLPFVNGINVDESFAGNRAPDYVLTEVSGLLYGLLCEATAPIYHPVEALLYGMTLSAGMSREKTETQIESLYKVIHEFEIGDSRMYGFWDAGNPASTDKSDVLLTSYINGDSLLAVVFNTGSKGVEFDIGINPKLGFTSKDKEISAPLITGLQNKKVINFNKSFYLGAQSGLLLIVR